MVPGWVLAVVDCGAREFYISEPAIAADLAHVLEELARAEDD